jgi:hypothetical protein
MTHLAMLKVDDEGNGATWGDHVTAEEYNAAPRNSERLGKPARAASARDARNRR